MVVGWGDCVLLAAAAGYLHVLRTLCMLRVHPKQG
jgi:hypothetical protein